MGNSGLGSAETFRTSIMSVAAVCCELYTYAQLKCEQSGSALFRPSFLWGGCLGQAGPMHYSYYAGSRNDRIVPNAHYCDFRYRCMLFLCIIIIIEGSRSKIF